MSAPLLVVGEALVDVVESPGRGRTEHPGGSPLNVAVAAARLGAPAVLATQLGDDASGRLIRAHAEGSGVRVCSVPPHRPTGSATARIGAGGAAAYEFDVTWDPERLPAPDGYAAVHAGSIGVALQPGADRVLSVLARAAVAGVPVTLDPNVRPAITPDLAAVRTTVARATALAWGVKLSEEDADLLWPGRSIEAVVDELATAGPELVALTRGAESSLLGSGAVRVEVPARRTDVVDTIGAGDTFMGTLLASCARWGWLGRAGLSEPQLRAVGQVAVTAAAITCSRPGADPPWTAELGGAGANPRWTGGGPGEP